MGQNTRGSVTNRRGGAHMNVSRRPLRQRVNYARLAVFLLPLFLAIAAGAPATVRSAFADDCAKLSKEVIRLRGEYRQAAQKASQTDAVVGFDDLTTILDKIVDAKRRMRGLGCGEPKRGHKKTF